MNEETVETCYQTKSSVLITLCRKRGLLAFFVGQKGYNKRKMDELRQLFSLLVRPSPNSFFALPSSNHIRRRHDRACSQRLLLTRRPTTGTVQVYVLCISNSCGTRRLSLCNYRRRRCHRATLVQLIREIYRGYDEKPQYRSGSFRFFIFFFF